VKVITGLARGKRLKMPKGMAIRPTASQVKESVFNIIQFRIPGSRVLDLFAGTGQMGIEALSRGASAAVFVDASATAAGLVRENLKHTGLAGGSVVLSEAEAYLARGERFDLIFLDPPYAAGHMNKIIKKIQQFDILRENGIMICESPAGHAMPVPAPPYAMLREYRYGKVKITTYTRNGQG